MACRAAADLVCPGWECVVRLTLVVLWWLGCVMLTARHLTHRHTTFCCYLSHDSICCYLSLSGLVTQSVVSVHGKGGRRARFWLRRGRAHLPLCWACCAGPAGPAGSHTHLYIYTYVCPLPLLCVSTHCTAASTAHTHAIEGDTLLGRRGFMRCTAAGGVTLHHLQLQRLLFPWAGLRPKWR